MVYAIDFSCNATFCLCEVIMVLSELHAGAIQCPGTGIAYSVFNESLLFRK